VYLLGLFILPFPVVSNQLLELLLLCAWQCYYIGSDLLLAQERPRVSLRYTGIYGFVADTHLALGLSILYVCYVCVKSYF